MCHLIIFKSLFESIFFFIKSLIEQMFASRLKSRKWNAHQTHLISYPVLENCRLFHNSYNNLIIVSHQWLDLNRITFADILSASQVTSLPADGLWPQIWCAARLHPRDSHPKSGNKPKGGIIELASISCWSEITFSILHSLGTYWTSLWTSEWSGGFSSCSWRSSNPLWRRQWPGPYPSYL